MSLPGLCGRYNKLVIILPNTSVLRGCMSRIEIGLKKKHNGLTLVRRVALVDRVIMIEMGRA